MTPILTVDRVCKSYGRIQVLRSMSFSVWPGEAVAITGPNGAGKTTMLRAIAGLVRADSGEVRIAGEPLPGALSRTRVAYFGGESTLPSAVPVSAWRRLFLESPGWEPERRSLGLLSRGTRQMVALRTIFSLPALRLIVLDEPWEGLDPDAARWLGQAVRARRAGGAALILSSHRLHELAGLCDRYLFLSAGIALAFEARALGAADHVVTADALLKTFDRVRGGGS